MRSLKSQWICVVGLAPIFFSGCASVTNSDIQNVSVMTRDKAGYVVSGAECRWQNSKGSGVFRTPAVVPVRRDYAAVNIVCSKEGLPDTADAFNSRSTAAMAGNIFAGGLIGAAIDHSSGAAYDYPPVITVWFGGLLKDSSKPPVVTQAPVTHATQMPAPSGFARVDDVNAVPKLSPKGRALYEEWLAKPFPRAVAVSDKGAMARGYGSKAMETAVQNCERLFGNPCRLYAVDDQVVWPVD